MTTAAEIMNIARNANDAIARAEDVTSNIDQDWEHEATIYTFADESALVVSGPQVNAYASADEAKAALCS